MADDLTIQTAASLVTMQMEHGAQELGTKLMKMRLQQDQQLVELLAEQAKQIQQAGYTNTGRAVAPVGSGGVDMKA